MKGTGFGNREVTERRAGLACASGLLRVPPRPLDRQWGFSRRLDGASGALL